MKFIVTILLGIISFSFLSICLAFEDEPDELNWDRLGGTLTAFHHFQNYVSNHSDFAQKLLAEKPDNAAGHSTQLSSKVATVWINPEAFMSYSGNQWNQEQREGRTILTYPAGHGGGHTRTKITIPNDGYYRIWAEYYHEQGTVASFVLRLEDPAGAALDNMFQTVVQNVFSWKFDFAELGRQTDLLPNRKEEPTGFLWEASPMIWLKAGEQTITLTGTIHDGPFAPRRLASVVLTEEPLAIPKRPNGSGSVLVDRMKISDEAKEASQIWERRPVLEERNRPLIALWKTWREAFFADLAEYRLDNIEGRRMASLVAFDEDSNLIGTPRQIRDEKERMKEFFQAFPRNAFMQKIEGESFQTVREGWNVENHSEASNGQLLIASYGDGLCDSDYQIDLPRSGSYCFWTRYLELPGYLSEFRLQITDSVDKTEEIVFCADKEANKTSPGFRWKKQTLTMPAGPCHLTISKESGPGLTYRRFDCLVVTDALEWEPERQGEIVVPHEEDLAVWRVENPWQGFSRLTAPQTNEGLDPLVLELPQGGVQSCVILLRNGSDSAKTICPEIEGDSAQLLSWRVPAFIFSSQFGWQPMPLLERASLTIPAWETAGLWLTFDGSRSSKNEEIVFRIAGKEQRFQIKRQGNLDRAPVPYVGGWAAPYETVSCWETFHRLGLNVINDVVIPMQQAKQYGIRLFLKLNDPDISKEHIALIEKLCRDYEIPYENWAWSFMDEPGTKSSDQWVKLAQEFRSLNSSIQIWCNPGEIESASAESNLKMLPFIDCYCPYVNHFWTKGEGNDAYLKELLGKGRDYPIRLTYSTPCSSEKSPGAPNDMFMPQKTSLEYKLDGWMFYALLGRYEYCNSVWDEVNMFHTDQSINLYPGAGFRTISTRNAEAIRAAVDIWRANRLKNDALRQK